MPCLLGLSSQSALAVPFLALALLTQSSARSRVMSLVCRRYEALSLSYQVAQAVSTSWLSWKRVGSHGGLFFGCQESGLSEAAGGLGGPEACCFVGPHESAAGSVELALG